MDHPLLTIDHIQLDRLSQREQGAFLLKLQHKLEQVEPALLPRFPDAQRAIIAKNVHLRGLSVGLTWQSALAAWGGYMVAIAPNIGADPAVRAWLNSTGPRPDEAVTSLPDLLSDSDWARIDANRCDLPLFVPPELDRHTIEARVAHAMAIVLWDHVAPDRALGMAGAAVIAAERLGFGGLDDAPIAVAAWHLLYGRSQDHRGHAWPAEVQAADSPPATRLAMLRARIMLDHGRWT